MPSKTFGAWPIDVHDDPEQIKRQKSASEAKLTPQSIDHAHQIAVFKGSGKKPYDTTLEKCTCIDFFRRRLPCKHIYRLAFELGVFDPVDQVKSGPQILTVDEVFAMLPDFDESDWQMFGYFCYSCGNDNKKGAQVLRIPMARKLEELGLVHIQKVMRVNARATLDERIAPNAHRIHRAVCKLYPSEEDDWWEQ